ncbi:MAG TPA: tyrosine-type recombinase/integrase [Rubricoccaceae bacterium]|jgi:integrase
MASLLCRSGNYYATFADSRRTPAQRRLSLHTTNKRAAERMLRRLADGYSEGAFDPWVHTPADFLAPEREPEPQKLGPALALYFARKGLAASTERSYRSRLGRFVASVGEGRPLAAVTRAEVQAWIDASLDPLTAESDLTAIKSFFRFCRDAEWTKADPAGRVAKPKAPPRLPRAVEDDELGALLAAIRPGRVWCRPVFEFAALTGLRCSELARLQWEDVDFTHRLLRIETQKNGLAQTQPISRTAAALLDSLERRGQYVFTSPAEVKEGERNVMAWAAQIQRTFRLAKEKAGIRRRITPHGLRHRYCTKLAEAGANAFTIQAAARHSDVQTSARYVSISNQKLSAELDAVFG